MAVISDLVSDLASAGGNLLGVNSDAQPGEFPGLLGVVKGIAPAVRPIVSLGGGISDAIDRVYGRGTDHNMRGFKLLDEIWDPTAQAYGAIHNNVLAPMFGFGPTAATQSQVQVVDNPISPRTDLTLEELAFINDAEENPERYSLEELGQMGLIGDGGDDITDFSMFSDSDIAKAYGIPDPIDNKLGLRDDLDQDGVPNFIDPDYKSADFSILTDDPLGPEPEYIPMGRTVGDIDSITREPLLKPTDFSVLLDPSEEVEADTTTDFSRLENEADELTEGDDSPLADPLVDYSDNNKQIASKEKLQGSFTPEEEEVRRIISHPTFPKSIKITRIDGTIGGRHGGFEHGFIHYIDSEGKRQKMRVDDAARAWNDPKYPWSASTLPVDLDLSDAARTGLDIISNQNPIFSEARDGIETAYNEGASLSLDIINDALSAVMEGDLETAESILSQTEEGQEMINQAQVASSMEGSAMSQPMVIADTTPMEGSAMSGPIVADTTPMTGSAISGPMVTADTRNIEGMVQEIEVALLNGANPNDITAQIIQDVPDVETQQYLLSVLGEMTGITFR